MACNLYNHIHKNNYTFCSDLVSHEDVKKSLGVAVTMEIINI